MDSPPVPPDLLPPPPPDRFERAVHFMLHHWLLWINLGLGLYALLPWLSPLARLAGWESLGQLLFRLYSPPICHQQPASSYFLGGYQVAYCERDTAMYTAIFLAGLLFGLHRRMRPWPWWSLILCMVPIAVDGVTQVPRSILVDYTLRTANLWAIALTGGIFPPTFYAGDAVGSLNWLLRTVTGVLFGVGLVFTMYPLIDTGMKRSEEAGSKRQEARGRKQEAGSKRQEARGRKQEAGSKRQEARGRKQVTRQTGESNDQTGESNDQLVSQRVSSRRLL